MYKLYFIYYLNNNFNGLCEEPENGIDNQSNKLCSEYFTSLYNPNLNPASVSRNFTVLESFKWAKKQKPQLVGVYVILLGWMGVFCLLLLQKGQTKVTMDTPSSYCTTADNFLSNELQLYFWVLRHVSFQKKRQWVRFIHEQTLCSDLGLTFSFLFYWWQLKHKVWAAVFFLCKSGRFAVLRNTTNVKMKTFLV